MRLIKHIQNFQVGGITKSELETSKYILNRLINSGISPKVSSAITGNLIRESRLNPQALSETGKYFGIAQWGESRRDELMSFAKSQKKSPSDLDLQVDFIVKELKGSHKKVWDKAEKAKDVISSANIISGEYEVAGHKESFPERAEFAKTIYNLNTPKNFKIKSEKVNIADIHNNLTYYLNTLPENLKEKVLITSGNDQGHSTKSRHYQNKAIDLRLNPELYDYMKTDPNRLKYGITLLDPNHGSAPHIHLSYGDGTENKKDVWKDPFSKNRDWEILDLTNEEISQEIQPQNNLTTSPYNIERQDLSNQAYLSAIEGKLNTATEELVKFQEERAQEQKKQETLQQEDAQRQVLQQAQQQKEEIYNLLTANPPESLQYDVSPTQQAFSQIQPFQFQSDFYSGEGLFQEGGMFNPENQRNFFVEYLQSPKYKERLINQNYPNPDEVIKQRLFSLLNTPYKEYKTGKVNSHFRGTVIDDEGDVIFKPTIIINNEEISEYPKETVVAHEFSHASQKGINGDYGLNNVDVQDLEKRNMYFSIPFSSEGFLEEDEHNADPEELKADLDALRYLLKKDGIYDTGTQNFNQEVLKKAKEKYKGNHTIDRLFEKVKTDKDLIYLMNNIAYNQSSPQFPIYAKTGGEMSPLSKIKKKFQAGGEILPKLNFNNFQYNAQYETLPEAVIYGKKSTSPNELQMIPNQTANTFPNMFGNVSKYFFNTEDSELIESPYKPTKSTNTDIKYYIRPGMKEDVYKDLTSEKVKKDYNHTGEFEDIFKALKANGEDREHDATNSFSKNKVGYKGMYNLGSPGKLNRGQFNFGRYTVDAGEDEKGKYISFYDVYDWNGSQTKNPIPFYGRIYEEEWGDYKNKIKTKQEKEEQEAKKNNENERKNLLLKHKL